MPERTFEPPQNNQMGHQNIPAYLQYDIPKEHGQRLVVVKDEQAASK